MKIMERKYVCKNGVVERTRYVAGDNAVPRGKRKKGNTSFRKQEANYNTAVKRLARTLNCNFDSRGGLLLTLDYDDRGLEKLIAGLAEEHRAVLQRLRMPVGQVGTWKKAGTAKKLREKEEEKDNAMDALIRAADKELTLFLRRLRRKAGTMKLCAVTADTDGQTGEVVRVHHHLVVQGEDLSWDLIKACWKHGSVDIRQLRNQPDYTPIAVYLLEQVRRKPDAKKYRVSRGMEEPEIVEREVTGAAELRVPPGATVLERTSYGPETVEQYVRYIPKKRESRRRGGKGGRDEIPQDQRDSGAI